MTPTTEILENLLLQHGWQRETVEPIRTLSGKLHEWEHPRESGYLYTLADAISRQIEIEVEASRAPVQGSLELG